MTQNPADLRPPFTAADVDHEAAASGARAKIDGMIERMTSEDDLGRAKAALGGEWTVAQDRVRGNWSGPATVYATGPQYPGGQLIGHLSEEGIQLSDGSVITLDDEEHGDRLAKTIQNIEAMKAAFQEVTVRSETVKGNYQVPKAQFVLHTSEAPAEEDPTEGPGWDGPGDEVPDDEKTAATKKLDEWVEAEPTRTPEEQLLLDAMEVIGVGGDRQRDYGKATGSFEAIATAWNGYLQSKRPVMVKVEKEAADRRNSYPSWKQPEEVLSMIGPRDVAMMMILMKVMRESRSSKRDNLVDICGYAALAELVEPSDR